MEGKVTPTAFYGSAIAALCGLLSGLLLHDAPWKNHSSGPQILFNSAAAAELARPAADRDASGEDQPTYYPSQVADLDQAYNDPGYIPPDPLPVTRLDPRRFGPDPADATQASAEAVERDDETADTAQAPAVRDFD